MLGGEQSSHIEAVGFEMYLTVIAGRSPLRKMKGEEDKPAHAGAGVSILGISVRIDSSYIPEENQRLRIAKRSSPAPRTRPRLADVRAELQDRYGEAHRVSGPEPAGCW